MSPFSNRTRNRHRRQESGSVPRRSRGHHPSGAEAYHDFSSIFHYPLQEARSAHPHAVLGMFYVSTRPYVPADMLSFTSPGRSSCACSMSFLITEAWEKVQERMSEKNRDRYHLHASRGKV
jgi:hypothetical protein